MKIELEYLLQNLQIPSRSESIKKVNRKFIFIPSREIITIARRYANQKRKSGMKTFANKDARELIWESSEGEHYFFKDNKCNVGEVLKFPEDELDFLQESKGELRSCANFLYSKDPYFENHPQIELYPERPFVALFDLGIGNIRVTPHCLSKFQSRGLISDYISKTHGRNIKTKRGSLKSLFTELKGAKQVERRNRLRQLLENNCVPADYFTSHGWIYVIEEGRVLKTCYEKGDISKAGYRLKK